MDLSLRPADHVNQASVDGQSRTLRALSGKISWIPRSGATCLHDDHSMRLSYSEMVSTLSSNHDLWRSRDKSSFKGFGWVISSVKIILSTFNYFSVSSSVFFVDSVDARNSQHLEILKIQRAAFASCLRIAYAFKKTSLLSRNANTDDFFHNCKCCIHLRKSEAWRILTMSNTHDPSACGSQDHLYHAATWASPTDPTRKPCFMSWTNAMKQFKKTKRGKSCGTEKWQ